MPVSTASHTHQQTEDLALMQAQAVGNACMYTVWILPAAGFRHSVCQVAHPYILLSCWSLAIRAFKVCSLTPLTGSYPFSHTVGFIHYGCLQKQALENQCYPVAFGYFGLPGALCTNSCTYTSSKQLSGSWSKPMALLVADIQILWSR